MSNSRDVEEGPGGKPGGAPRTVELPWVELVESKQHRTQISSELGLRQSVFMVFCSSLCPQGSLASSRTERIALS